MQLHLTVYIFAEICQYLSLQTIQVQGMLLLACKYLINGEKSFLRNLYLQRRTSNSPPSM